MTLLPSPPPTGTRPTRAAPVLAGAAVAAATAVVAFVSPEEPGTYPACPFHVLTGWWCPGCGSLRAVHALAHGDVATAVDRNVLLVVAVPILVLAWVAWLGRSLPGHTAGQTAGQTRWRVPWPAAITTGPAAWTLIATVGAFWVLRNVPAGSWLAP